MLVWVGVACVGESSDSGDEPPAVEVSREVPVADVTVMDVYRPAEGTDLPMLVLLHGTGEGGRAEMEPLAQAIAEEGAVVFVPSWKVVSERPERPISDAEIFRDQTEAVVCALRHARRVAPDVGGSPHRLALMGHSGGALVGLRAALLDDPPWSGITCDDDVDHRPSVFIGTGGDYSGQYQFTSAWGDLYEPFDPEQLIGGNTDLVVELIHGFRDSNVDAYASAQLHEELLAAGYDARYTARDTRHGALIQPTESAGEFVVDRVLAVLGRRTDDNELTAEFSFDGTECTYSGPNTLAPGERLSIRLHSNSDAATYFLFYNVEGIELDAALIDEPAVFGVFGSEPSYVGMGSGRMVPAQNVREMGWAFVDRPYQWILACVDDLEPHGSTYYRIRESSLIYHGAGLAPTTLG